MTFVNLYKPPAPTPSKGPLDINFGAPFPPSGFLESSLVKIVPFDRSLHLQPALDDIKKQPDFFQYLAHAFEEPDFLDDWMEGMRQDPTSIGLTVIDKTKEDPQHPEFGGSVAGIFGLYHSSFADLKTEIGPAFVFPSYQRSHVSTHTIGLILRWCLELPSAGGLGMRRVQWEGNPENAATIKVAKKMGFMDEGTMRWTYVIPMSRPGRKSRGGDPQPGVGRDSTMLAICWDDWEATRRDHVTKIMEGAEARFKQT